MDEIEDEYAHLSEEHSEFLKRALSGKFDQGANGYDLTMFRANLCLTPTERIKKLQRAYLKGIEPRPPCRSRWRR